MDKQVKGLSNNKACQRNRRNRSNNKNNNKVNGNNNDDDFLTKQAKDLIVAAAASVLLNRTVASTNNSCIQCNCQNISEYPIQPGGQIRCHHPIQMKPADIENRYDRKLFVGMLSKSMCESDVRAMFSPYGVIEECTILKDSNGQSKGCAFVTYSSRSSASNAIKALHHTTTLEGCTSPLVVKFADTQKDKEVRRGQQSIMQQLWSTPTTQLTTPLISTTPYLAALTALTNSAQQQQLALAIQQPYINPDLSLATALASNPVLMAAALTGTSHTKVGTNAQQSFNTHSHYKPVNKLINVNDSLTGVRDHLSTLTGSLTTGTPYLSALPQLNPSITTSVVSNSSLTSNANQKQLEGPEGANLFIYHLPPEFNDADLINTFSPFGNILSAKVFIDKVTNLSKCFGFVSYDNTISAQAAIQAMHGFQIRNKRLKVQLKKSREKPY